MIKKYIAVLALLGALTAPTQIFAISDDYDPGGWAFAFHFQIKNGVLASLSESKLAYSPTLAVSEKLEPGNTDYRIDIIGVRGNLLGTYGFNDPKTYVAVLDKTVFDVVTPFYANGKKAEVYAKSGKKLFEIDLGGTSFCNDNKVCDMNVGENFSTCPNDCPPPPSNPPPSPSGITPPSTNPTPPPTTSEIEPVAPNLPGTNNGEVVRTPGLMEGNNKIMLVFGVGFVLFAVLGFVVMRARKSAAEKAFE